MSGNTIFTSDLHFCHKNIVMLTQRSLATTAEEHDQWLIDLWNQQVDPNDTVYHLGDFCFHGKPAQWGKILSQLNGTKVLIKGNHDSSRSLRHCAQAGLISAWYDYREINIDGQDLTLFHFPISSWHRQNYGSFHIHGHSHGGHRFSRGKMLDVGLDSAFNLFGHHRFFTWYDVKEYMSQQDIEVADQHRKVQTEGII